MYPHGRLLFAAVVFSASFGLFIALAAFALALLESSGVLGQRPDDSPLHFISFLMFVFAPAMASLSLAASVAASYHFWRKPIAPFSRIALTVSVLAYVLVASLLLPKSTVLATAVVGTVLAGTAIAAAFLWTLAMPRSDS